MTDGDAYWEWRDSLLMHPDGRAKGGEPCVKCGAPVPPNAHWKNRDRHVCSPACNQRLNRQISRRLQSGVTTDLHGRDASRPARPENPRVSGPRKFRTLYAGTPPFEWEGYGVVPGDVVERYGVVTVYGLMHRESEEGWPDWWPDHLLTAMERESRHTAYWATDADGNLGSLCLGYAGPDGRPTSNADFTTNGVDCRWYLERVSACTTDDREYAWEAILAAPLASVYKPGWWTPERDALSERRKRETALLARHSRRVRERTATVERFDHLEVYERDGWVCGLCRKPVEPDLAWPDPLSPSLDHVVPLAAGGDHSRANTQLAHWICNVRKGARSNELGQSGPTVDSADSPRR